MYALIDLDILCYEMGSAKDDEGFPLKWPLVQSRVDERIWGILDSVEAEGWQGYLTGKENFREKIATIQPYKGHRNRGERPFWYSAIYSYLSRDRGAIVVDRMEADDALAIRANLDPDSVIICSRDKDLLMVPGWHYQWPSWKQEEQHPFFVTELEGLRFFYTQLLIGDSADNILGLYGVGKKSASVKRVQEAETELQMFEEVKEQYRLRFGSYWDMFMCETGRLLWMKRTLEDDWYNRQKELNRGVLRGE